MITTFWRRFGSFRSYHFPFHVPWTPEWPVRPHSSLVGVDRSRKPRGHIPLWLEAFRLHDIPSTLPVVFFPRHLTDRALGDSPSVLSPCPSHLNPIAHHSSPISRFLASCGWNELAHHLTDGIALSGAQGSGQPLRFGDLSKSKHIWAFLPFTAE